MKLTLLHAALALSFVACQAPPVEESAAMPDWDRFGAQVATAPPVPLGQVLTAAQQYRGQTLITEGVVENVCPKKGCWMMLRDGDRAMRVTFKDYGFFVPMDIHGRTVRMEGVFDVEEISVADQQHYLMDAGKPEEAAKITEAEMQYVFEATGVCLAPQER